MNAEPGVDPLLRVAGPNMRRPHVLCPEVLETNRIVGFGPMNEQVHPFFMIRSALLNHATNTHQRIFAITSAEPGNGKTHVAVNLAATLSRIHPTVLIELDLRQPSIGSRLGLAEETPGVDDYLSGEAAWHETAIAIEGFDLAIHRVRRARVNAEGLLASPALPHVLRHLADEGNGPICIIDTPPALACDDLVLIGRCVDGFLLIVEEARSRKRDVIDLGQTLSPVPIIGTILNNSISQAPRSNAYGHYEYCRESYSSRPPGPDE